MEGLSSSNILGFEVSALRSHLLLFFVLLSDDDQIKERYSKLKSTITRKEKEEEGKIKAHTQI